MTLAILTTGGTIDKIYFDAKGGYAVGDPMVRQILANARMTDPVTVVEVLRKDSLEIGPADRAAIVTAVEGCEATRVVITHGTDTMVESARVLEAFAGKTIVLTGALQPGRFVDSDAAFNLGMAVGVAQVLAAGVYIVANGRVFAAAAVRKNVALNRFEDIPAAASSP
jgi:L-asparaginase